MLMHAMKTMHLKIMKQLSREHKAVELQAAAQGSMSHSSEYPELGK
jgi:hypothetical protein